MNKDEKTIIEALALLAQDTSFLAQATEMCSPEGTLTYGDFRQLVFKFLTQKMPHLTVGEVADITEIAVCDLAEFQASESASEGLPN